MDLVSCLVLREPLAVVVPLQLTQKNKSFRTEENRNSHRNLLSSTPGTLVIADVNGNPIPDPGKADPNSVYYYVFYNDADSSAPAPCNGIHSFCIAVARAQKSALVAAAFSGNTGVFPTLFQKYYFGSFLQPGTGQDPNNGTKSGHYTPMFNQVASQPTVLYDRAINQFLMAYQVGFELYIQASPNLLSWSGNPLPNGSVNDMPNEIGYRTLVGEGSHPEVGGLNPYLFYLSAYPPFPIGDRRQRCMSRGASILRSER